ncbi:MAG TPA: hypothetical protein VE083_04570 [Terriglobales bacterium]|nr:hypothetical protein [Terriglobales bacterium]
MRVRILPAWLVLLSTLTAAHGVQKEYATGRIVDVQERSRDRVLLYQVNTPIMTGEPYFTLSVEVNGIVYEGEYLPRDLRQPFPRFWKAGEDVLLRVDKHFLYLKRADGTEAKFLTTSRSRSHAVRESQ